MKSGFFKEAEAMNKVFLEIIIKQIRLKTLLSLSKNILYPIININKLNLFIPLSC